ncbi:probable F-box protein At3g61730 [Hordeum vulgare subsp. vulgare]|uniref:probable F-box protein At3g61730 n=1 Tax=Hordeum vulgare subsp. vulgare TaxID=112509 RepID=UPI001D1A4E66|nr:probable F-box protein At3g61730 [Hordeum vulgare subsp. vulgare]
MERGGTPLGERDLKCREGSMRDEEIVASVEAKEGFEPDTWTEVANHLHVTDLSILSATCRSFRRLLSDDSIWRHAFLRDITLHTDDTNMLRILHAPRPFHRSWRFLYATALDPIVSYCIRQPEKHIELFRVGGFVMDTSKLLLTAKLALAPLWLMKVLDNTLDTSIGACLLTNVRPGVWIADMHRLRCLG